VIGRGDWVGPATGAETGGARGCGPGLPIASAHAVGRAYRAVLRLGRTVGPARRPPRRRSRLAESARWR